MSDFLFSSKPLPHNALEKSLSIIYSKKEIASSEFHGPWGSLAVTPSRYCGFQTLETDNYICVVIGGPVLYFRDNAFLGDDDDPHAGTRAILEHWEAGQADWSEDLSGPFVILVIDKQQTRVECITDLMMFIPVYQHRDDEGLFWGTHIDALAKACGQQNAFYEVSLADFFLNDVVTYPYTAYSKIRQLAPSSETTYSGSAHAPAVASYWVPYEENPYRNVKEAARALQGGILGYVNRVTEKMDSVAQFISAGEDSRALSGMLPERLNRDAYIFLDSMNREGTIAKRVADVYGAKFTAGFRKKTHYLDILTEASRLVGSGHQYTHAHSLTFDKTYNLAGYKAVFGGYLSDSLLKSAYTRKLRGMGRFPFLPEFWLKGEGRSKPVKSDAVDNSILAEITSRRSEHLKHIFKERPDTAHEWFVLRPATMRVAIPNLYSTRRLFASYEPFMCKEAVKISAAVPTSWKLNRRLFNHAMKPYLRKSKWMMHADGRLPYFSWWANMPLQFSVWTYRHIAKRIGIIKGNQGPWGDWQAASQSPVWMDMTEECAKYGDNLGFLKEGKATSELLNSSYLPVNNRVNLLQVAYQVGQSRNSGDHGGNQKLTRNSDVEKRSSLAE
jgi:hypothetical protein